MATTTYGTPYVQSSDLVSGYPSTSSSLATRVDDVSLKGNGVNTQTGTTYTLVLTDGGKTVTTSNAAAVTVTIPLNSSVAFPTGVYVTILNLGAGTMTVQGAGGVTLNGSGTSCAQYEATTLRKTASDTWVAVKGGPGKASVTATTGSPTVTTVSGKTCYQFTGSGTITIGNAGTCDILVVGGGGGCNWAGGGAGGHLYITNAFLDAGSNTVTVGAGGVGGTTSANPQSGIASRIGSYFSPGGGAGSPGGTSPSDGVNGASGGGGLASGARNAAGGAGISGIGNAGGTSTSNTAASGGGGSGAAGANGSSTTGGAGGNGTANSITGSSVTRCGGGGGAASVTQGSGGTGGGGNAVASGTGNSGSANTGGGAGGSWGGTGGTGGSGVVIILIG